MKPVPLLIISAYAPTAAADTEEKTRFYHGLRNILAENGGAMVIIHGDFNARILQNPGLPRHISPNFFQSTRPLGHQTVEVLENRDLFLDFLIQNDLVALNTLHEGPSSTQITHRNPGQPTFEPPWEEHRYAQINFILTKARWRNHLASTQTCPTQNYDSDHLPVKATLCAKLIFGKTPKPKPKTRHNRTTTKEEKTDITRA